MAEIIDIRDIYMSVISSLDEANQKIDDASKERAFSYAITDLEFSLPFNDINIDKNEVKLSFPKKEEPTSEARNIKFKVRYVPRNIVQENKPLVEVPNLLQLKYKEAVKIIKINELLLGKVKYDGRKKPAGHVIAQSPEGGSEVEIGSKINLVISGRPIKKGR